VSSLVFGEEKGAAQEAKPGLTNQPQAASESAPAPKAELAEDGDLDYELGPGDQLDIAVWKDDALTRSLAILPDGKISFPLVGEMVAAGKTVSQIKRELEEKLSPFLPKPVLSVEVKQVNSQLIYVLGRVNTPGRFVLNANINVLQALAIAGGFNPFADRSSIKIIRYEGEKTKVIKFDYDYVVKKEKPELNFGLKRGDVIVVP